MTTAPPDPGAENAYTALTREEVEGDARWAFGTGFDDPLAGIDTSTPAGAAPEDLGAYCLMLGDDALITSQRLIEWVTHAPELEVEVALSNIALDLLGQARLLLTRAGQVDGSERTEDAFAYFRDAAQFRNVCLTEQPTGDFAVTVARLLVFSTWRLALFARLADTGDPVISAIAAKGVNELRYHRDFAAGWTVRLGDGTAESHERMRAGLATVWPWVGELFAGHDIERRLSEQGFAVDPATSREEVEDVIATVCQEATLPVPPRASASPDSPRGRSGQHTEALAALLEEMQGLARTHPEASW